MGKMMVAERQQKILELLNTSGVVKINELSELLQVSKETIRKDLSYLEENGKLKKSHGGAMSIKDRSNIEKTPTIAERNDKYIATKIKLCQKAMELIPDQGVIFLDAGTTVQYMAKLLKDASGYMIVTTSLSCANALIGSKNVVLLTGGQLNEITLAMEGFQTVDFINDLKTDIAFLGTSGFDQHAGPASSELNDTQNKKAIAANSKLNVVIADSSKSTYTSLIQYASWKDIDYLIIDSGISKETYEAVSAMTNVILV